MDTLLHPKILDLESQAHASFKAHPILNNKVAEAIEIPLEATLTYFMIRTNGVIKKTGNKMKTN